MDCFGSPTKKSRPGRMRHLVPGLLADVGVVTGEEDGDFDLDRVGVLELVDEEGIEAAREVAADGRIRARASRGRG